MKKIAILYDTREGQTEKIAGRLAEVLRKGGHEVRVDRLRGLPDDFQIDPFDGVIVGGSVHLGKHSPRLVHFVKEHAHQLNEASSFFFSVSLSAAGESEKQQEDARRCVEQLLDQTGWRPRKTATFAGALRYREYNWLLRWFMKRIAAKEGGDTDTSRNYEYTDWEKVEAFALECAASPGSDSPKSEP